MTLRELIPWKRKGLVVKDEDSLFDSWHREMNRIFGRLTQGFGREQWWESAFPIVDISETEKELLVTAELPGMDAKDLDVFLQDKQLIIRGEKKEEQEKQGEQYYQKESSYGTFRRTILLPVAIEEDQIEASYQRGVLKIRLPKSADA